jgi:hypothetical protein
VSWRGAEALPHDIAVWVAKQGEKHAWFPDVLDLAADHAPQFGEAEISEARSLRHYLGVDITYRDTDLPTGSDALPALGRVDKLSEEDSPDTVRCDSKLTSVKEVSLGPGSVERRRMGLLRAFCH